MRKQGRKNAKVQCKAIFVSLPNRHKKDGPKGKKPFGPSFF